MFFQPAILALLLASGLGLAALLVASPWVLQLVRHWNLQSGSRLQLVLERRTYLLSTLVGFVLVVQMAALLLFIFNADRMAVQFVGAMCAVGTLQANAYGFPALYAQLAVFFLASGWLVLHAADARAPDYPLTRIKFVLLVAVLLPAVALSFGLQWLYFGNLSADVITSCCGSLFSVEATDLGGDLAGLPPGPALWAFTGTLLAATAAAAVQVWRGRASALVGVLSAAAFVVAIAGIISFLSLYIYEHPHHHCPFCILKPEYGYRGYLLYLPLFAASAAGIGVGILGRVAHVPSLQTVAPDLARRLAWVALLGFGIFLLLSLGLVWHSGLMLLEGA